MTIVKPLRLGLLNRAQQEPPKVYYFVTALGYFDLMEPGDFDLETKMWPMVAAAMGGTPLDVGMPKPRGEVVVIGEAVAPAGRPVTQMAVEFSVGPVRKRMTVIGDRYWQLTRDGAAFSRPQSFERMPLGWDRAFGGPAHPDNPFGTGHGALARLKEGQPVRLPNIEDASNLILDAEHSPNPVGCAPLDVMAPVRQRHAGTYDDSYLKRHFPGHAPDFDWAFYNTVPVDQRAPGFFRGDEEIRIVGMHEEHGPIRSRLPGMRVRAFANVERGGGRTLTEVDMRCETVVLFPAQLKGVVIYRGGCEIADIDGKDVVDVMLAYERLGEASRSVEHYAATLAARTDPETAAMSFFDEKPLRPDIPELELAERDAEREAFAAERDAKWDKRVVASLTKAYLSVGAVPPPPDVFPKAQMPVKLPTITPADIERMDVDMVGLWKGLNELKAYGDAQIANARQQAAKAVAEAMDALDGPGGGLLSPANAAKLKAAAASLPAPPAGGPSVLPADLPTLDTVRQTLAQGSASPGTDPFEDLLAAIEATKLEPGPLTDEEAVALRARAEGRPEAGIAAPLLAQLDAIDLTAGGKVEPTAVAPTPAAAADTESFLEKLGLDERTAGAFGAVNAAIDKLGANADLARPLLAAKAPDPASAGDPGELIADAKAKIEEMTPKLEDAMNLGREMSPDPLAPMEPLRTEQVEFLSMVIRECLAAGGDFTGRDWAGADLRGVDFSGLDLRGAKFERADLTGAVFRGANLEKAVFTAAALTGADFSGCPMSGANLSKVQAEGARFAGSDLSDARLIDARLVAADLSQVTLENVVALNADLTRADLTGARGTKVMFMTATMVEAILDGTEFRQCIFLQVPMQRISARGAVLQKCALVDCKVAGSDFTGADLTGTGSMGGTDYSNSTMRDLVAPQSGWSAAVMVGVDLSAARLDGADLGKADLTGARMVRTSLRKAVMVETVMVDVDATAATFMEAILRKVDLRSGSLRYANFYRANLDATDLTYCDLTGVNELGTNLMWESDVAG